MKSGLIIRQHWTELVYHHHQPMKGNYTECSLNASPSYMLQKLVSVKLNLLAPQITAPIDLQKTKF